MALLHGAVGWSAVCDCGIFRSYPRSYCESIQVCKSTSDKEDYTRGNRWPNGLNTEIEIVNFPYLHGDVPRSLSYISQLTLFSRVCSNVEANLLTAKLLKQGHLQKSVYIPKKWPCTQANQACRQHYVCFAIS